MRTHTHILKDAGTARVHAVTGVESIHTVRSWFQRGRVPDEHWKAFADAKLATLEELASAVARQAAA